MLPRWHDRIAIVSANDGQAPLVLIAGVGPEQPMVGPGAHSEAEPHPGLARHVAKCEPVWATKLGRN